MKKQTIKKLSAFIIMMMLSISFTSAQSCNNNKIRVYKCSGGVCSIKCVNPNNIPAGWNTVGCGMGCGFGSPCNCNVRPLPFGCGQICGFRISSTDNDNSFSSFITSIVPNPVSTSATISFSLEQSEKVLFRIFDLNGSLIKILADHIFEAGENELMWNADEVNAGIYFLQMQTAADLQTAKLIVTK